MVLNGTSGEDVRHDVGDDDDDVQSRAAKVDEQKLVRKLDLYLIPLIMALYLFSFLDR